MFMASEIQIAPGESDETSPQRGATRAPVRKPVRLQFDDAIDIVEARCRDVSIGGMFVHSSEGRPVGSLVRFELMLDDDVSIRGLAEVVWMRSQDQGTERVAGMGLKFRFLEQRDRQHIFKLVSQHIKERLAARHPGLGDSQAEEEPTAPPPIRAPASTVERVTKPATSQAATPVPVTPVPAASRSTAPLAVASPPSGELLPSIDEMDAADDFDDDYADDSGQRSLLFSSDDAESTESVHDYDPGSPSGAWLQQGLRSEGHFEASAGFGSADEPVADAGYEYEAYEHEPVGEDLDGELYSDETHFERRPKPRRDIPILTLVALVVTVLAVSAYLWGDLLFDRGTDDVVPTPLANAALESDPVTDESADPAPTQDPVSSAPQAATPTPAPTQTPIQTMPPPRAEAQPAQESTAPGRPFRVVRDISARVAGAEVEIVITTDGSVEANRFSHARLPEGAPRELIRLRGLSTRFATEKIPVGIGAVRQVRTGWHRKSSGNELHIVIDLASDSAQLTGVRVEGHRIIASVKG